MEDETDTCTATTLADVSKKLEQRLKHLRYLKKQLDDKRDWLVREITNFDDFKQRLDKAFKATDEPVNIARVCLTNGEKRVDIDLTDGKKELQKEIQTIKGVQTLLKTSAENSIELLGRVTLQEWQTYNISSVAMTLSVDGLIHQAVNDIRQQVDNTNVAFAKQIRDCKDAKEQLKESRQKELLNQLELKEEIAIKTNALFIDEVLCMGIRNTIHIQNI